MGLGSSLKDLYYHLEDRYYEVLDRINSKVPICKITDQIDKVVPSFALLLLLIAILLVYLAMVFILPVLAPKPAVLTIRVVDDNNNPLNGASVEIQYKGKTTSFTTDEDGGIGEFKVFVGTKIDKVKVSLKGYKIKTPGTAVMYGVPVESEKKELEFVLEEIITTKKVRFQIVDRDTQQLLDGKNISLAFKCSNPDVDAPRPMTTTSGIIEVTVSKKCGVLTADVMASGYSRKSMVPVSDGTSIFLKAREEPKPEEPKYGKIIVDIYFNGQRVEDQEITVNLYKVVGTEDNVRKDSARTTNGQVTFDNLLPGKYAVKSLATETLTGEESRTISLNAGETEHAKLYLKERIVGHIKIRVLDKTSSHPVQDARVTLKFSESKKEVESTKTDKNGEWTFNLKKDAKYDLVIDKEGYCLKRVVELEKGDNVHEIKLTRFTGPQSACGGALIAKVRNDSDKPIAGAVAMLFDDKGFYVGTERKTDVNGEARFEGIGNGKYKVFAYKGYGNGWSDTKEFRVREGEEKEFYVTLTIPEGSIRLHVTDEEGEPLWNRILVTVRHAVTDEKLEGPVPVENEDGTRTFNVTAGEPVYFVVQDKDNYYANYLSEPVRVEPDSTRDVNVQLEIKRVSGGIKAEFLGLFKKNQKVSIVGAGEEYTARFRLSIPVTAGYDSVGFHVRTGSKSKMEFDQIYIKEENVPGKPDIMRGTSYAPGNGINYDSQFYSADGSKWMNFEWAHYKRGVIYLSFRIKVRETASADSELPIFWRGWAKKGNQLTRDPVDSTLGSSESNKELYADTYKQSFQVGVETLCNEKWCYSTKILDIEQDLSESIEDSYSAKVGKTYKLEFSILNNSKSETDTFQNVQLQVLNPEDTISFGSYSFAGELKVDGTANASETPEVSVGDLPINREVKGTIYFTPKSNLASTIKIRLHDPTRHEHIFEKVINVELQAAEEFDMEFEKEGEWQKEAPMLPSGIENELRVKVLRLKDGLEIENASVKLKNKFGDVLQETTTGSLGIAVIKLPIMKPGEKLYITAEKPDYKMLEKEVAVDNKVIEVNPDKLGFSLNIVEDLPDTKIVTLTNLTNMELSLDSVELQGNFEGLIDEEKARDWLDSEYRGKTIAPKGSIEISVKTELSDFALISEEGKSVKGKLNFTVSSLGESWVFSADVTVGIGLGGEVDDPNCLSLTKSKWTATIQEQQALTDFTIVNSCTVNGKPVELKNLSAKIDWKSNHLGRMEIKVDNMAKRLYGSYPKILRGVIQKEGSLDSSLTFTPDGGAVGTAEATITISAERATTGGKQVLSTSLDVSIKVVNVEGCLRVDKDFIKMKEGEDGSFSIEATDKCGGNVDVKLDSELGLSQKEFTIPAGQTKEITVLGESNIPGQYPVFINAKFAGNREYRFVKMIRVLIDTDGCIKLNKYEYDITDCPDKQYDGYDTGKIINVCHSKVVNAEVQFSEKNLWEAFVNSWPWAVAGFLWGGINAMGEGKTFWGTDKPETICANAGYELCGNKMVCANDDIKQVKNLICCASSCVSGEKGKSLKDDICEKKGFKYCSGEECQGSKVPVKGIYCCKGKCQSEFEFDTFMKICKSQGYQFCKEDEQCSKDYKWVEEGVKCCTGKCRTPEESPQMMVCKRHGLSFCNEKDGWSCPQGNEEYMSEGVKCCSAECIREENKTWTCQGKETCAEEHVISTEGDITICSEPCTEPKREMTTKDETCKSGGPEYDYCDADKGENCLYGNTVTVDGVECCTNYCTNMGYVDDYKLQCQANGWDFCDPRHEKCTGQIQLLTNDKYYGLPCCSTECQLLEPKGNEQTEPTPAGTQEEQPQAEAEKDNVCRQHRGGNWYYDHCTNGTVCFHRDADVIDGVNCCRHMCVDPNKTEEYKQVCAEQGDNYCDFKELYCPTGRLDFSQKQGYEGLPCCPMDCVPIPENLKQSLGNFTFECMKGEPVKGAEPYCIPESKSTVFMDFYHSNCSTSRAPYKSCDWFEECKNGGCVFRGDLTKEQKDAFCKSHSSADEEYDYFYNEPCFPGNIQESGIGQYKFVEGQTFGCCRKKKGTSTGTSGVNTNTGGNQSSSFSTADEKCVAGGRGGYCPEGYACKNNTCGRCGLIKPAYDEKTGEWCCSYNYHCVNPDGSNYAGGYVEETTPTPQETPTTNETTQESGGTTQNTSTGTGAGETLACHNAGYGDHCTESFCTVCAVDGSTCYDTTDPITTTYNGQQITCCPANGFNDKVGMQVSYHCPATASSAPQEKPGSMPVTMLELGGLIGAGGSLIGSVNQAVSALLGVDNPWTGLFLGAAAGTAYNYLYEQKEGKFDYATTVTDKNIESVKVFSQHGLEDVNEPKISVEMGESNLKADPDWPLGVKETEIVFKNNGIEQEEPYKPIFRGLKIEGESYDYNNQFNVKTQEDAKALAEGEFLTVKSKEGFSQKFHLQFDSYCPQKLKPKEWKPVSCMIGGMTGETGPQAVPKVLFKWDWSNVKDNTCDEDGGRTYCDATQFSIELLKKINEVNTLLRNGGFACPSAQGVLSEKSQELSKLDLDVGLTGIRIQKSGKSAKVVGTIESNNDKKMTVKAVIHIMKEGATTPIACPEAMEKSVDVVSRSQVECTFNDLDDGLYTASIEINPQLSSCESECKNEEPGNDSITTKFIVGNSGVFEKCEPYSTSRLAAYAAANPNNANLKKAVELTNFKANLIMDGYTNDFRSDFHDFAMTKSFFNTPSYYKGDTGLWKYFTNPELLKFDSSFLRPEAGKLESGKYQVRIIIDYDDDSWSLFNQAEPNARITVKLDWLSTPEPDSPFYYMPFDGLVGVDSENGRQGYGVNYRQESLEEIKVNDDPNQTIRTSTIAPSTPIPGGWIYTAESNNFKTLNNDKRGVLLDVSHTVSDSSIILSPSNATPVLLRVEGGKTNRAWAFYSLSIDGEPQIVGPSLTTWNGYVRGCRDFSDREIVENYMNRSDVHGGTTRENACGPIQRKSDYGLEWCDVKRQGIVYLSTMFFTPQGSESVLEMVDSQDSAYFIAPGSSGSKKIYLNGIFKDRIDSIEKVFDLVRKEDVCVAGVGNAAGEKFFWNPKTVIEKSLSAAMQKAESECIPPE